MIWGPRYPREHDSGPLEIVLGMERIVKEMVPLVSTDDMLVVKENGEDLVPAFVMKASAACFCGGTYPEDRGVVKSTKALAWPSADD